MASIKYEVVLVDRDRVVNILDTEQEAIDYIEAEIVTYPNRWPYTKLTIRKIWTSEGNSLKKK